MFAPLSTSRHRLLRGLLLLLGAGILTWLVAVYIALPGLQTESAALPPALAWPEPVLPAEEVWAAFRQPQGGAQARGGPLGQRFRLAGRFFAFGQSPDQPERTLRRAILDDLRESTQYLVGEGDQVGGFTVARIHHDRVVLRGERGEEELLLSFAGEVKGPGQPGAQPAASEEETEVVLETSRFGKRVGKARWVLQDTALRAYYQELLDHPERLASLYLSMKPDYKESAIKGYYLDVEGEADFFKTVGLENGDIIRRVNSMNMTSQDRAEYFISEFVKGRLGAVILDVERSGAQEKLIYLIRP